MNPFKIKIISIGIICFLILSNSIIALDELSVKMIGADETSSLLLHEKCQPIGLVLKMVPDVQGFFNVTPVNEAMFRKKAVELNANTVQPLFSFVENINGNVYTKYAYIRFWNCP
jgi:hypothetical protein